MLLFYHAQLVFFHEFVVVLLFDHFSHNFVVQLDSEVHVSKKTFIVMIALFLSVRQAKVLKCIVVDLLDVF